MQLADGERAKAITLQAETGKQASNYMQLLTVSARLQQILETCQMEIDLPSGVDEMLVPFLQAYETDIGVG